MRGAVRRVVLRGVQEAADAALMEEDLDAILARAEVVDTRALVEQAAGGGPSGAGGDLLNSFNVATFKVSGQAISMWRAAVAACRWCLLQWAHRPGLPGTTDSFGFSEVSVRWLPKSSFDVRCWFSSMGHTYGLLMHRPDAADR